MNWCVGMLLCSSVIFSCALGNPTTPPNVVEEVETSPAVEVPKLSVFKNALWKRDYVACPASADRQCYCPSRNTCCAQDSGDQKFGCCPYLNAVCCSDGFCCANGFTCIIESGTCVR
ncbi:hypothetical protein OS493_038147 [Desmophyllum pertusum]|uniref:Granulins domain-containing protein n=1 Tax=Desmophyllum pertusum TaxID=174260 RepID=A0A9X0CUB6_9CNID|nr:hypothetical protein OS493_038147 [Desmophyllum pertusum]